MADQVDPALTQIPGLSQYLAMKQYLVNQAQQEQQRGLQNEFIQRRQQLGPNASPEQLIGLGSQYVGPHDLVQYGQQSLDRQAAVKQRADAVEKMYDYHLKSMQNNIDNTLLRIKDNESARMLKDQWEKEKNDLLRQKNDIMEQLGVAKTQTQNKPPSGYRPTQEGNLEPIPGGPADLKIQGQFNQDTSALNNTQAELDRLATESNRLLNHPGLSKTTGAMSMVPGVGGVLTLPGTEAQNFKSGLETLKSQTGFSVLQNMRNNSKSGGALGQVSDFENKLLQANLASLDRAQSEPEFREALKKIIKYTDEAKGRLQNAYNMKHKQTPSGWSIKPLD